MTRLGLDSILRMARVALTPRVALYELFKLGVAKALLGLGPGWFTIRQLHMPVGPNLNPISQIFSITSHWARV